MHCLVHSLVVMLACSIIPAATQTNLTCQKPKIPGTSGLVPSSEERGSLGSEIELSCPGTKVGNTDRTAVFTATCTEVFRGYAEYVAEFGRAWPTCYCQADLTCSLPNNQGPAVFAQEYPTQKPGTSVVSLKIPLTEKQTKWSVTLTFDMATLEEFSITSSTEGVGLELMDSQGTKVKLSSVAKNQTLVDSQGNLELQLNIRPRDALKARNMQKWEFPCVKQLICLPEDTSSRLEEAQVDMNLVVAIVGGIAGINSFIWFILHRLCICCNKEEKADTSIPIDWGESRKNSIASPTSFLHIVV